MYYAIACFSLVLTHIFIFIFIIVLKCASLRYRFACKGQVARTCEKKISEGMMVCEKVNAKEEGFDATIDLFSHENYLISKEDGAQENERTRMPMQPRGIKQREISLCGRMCKHCPLQIRIHL